MGFFIKVIIILWLLLIVMLSVTCLLFIAFQNLLLGSFIHANMETTDAILLISKMYMAHEMECVIVFALTDFFTFTTSSCIFELKLEFRFVK